MRKLYSDFFVGWDHKKNLKKLVPKDLWRQFGNQESDDNKSTTEHSMSPYLSDFGNSSPNPTGQNANQLLYTLYSGTNQPWASFWGATAPDEDFVETYVLYALMAHVQSLQISINGFKPYDIIGGVAGKATLASKLQCVASLPPI